MEATRTSERQRLIAFSERVKAAFAAKLIRSPVHLAGSEDGTLENWLIDIFARHVRPGDWVCSNWRSMHHALLAGCDEEWLFSEILAGRSMSIFNAEKRFLSSAIVGGMLPIACGLAMAAKMRGTGEKVHVFIGDMTACCGLYSEFMRYCGGHNLPCRVYIEDNGYSTDTPTEAAWGNWYADTPIMCRWYKRRYPHVGIGERVQF